MSDIDYYDDYFLNLKELNSHNNIVERTISQYNTSTQSSRATTSYTSIHVNTQQPHVLSTISESSPTISPLPFTFNRTLSPTIAPNVSREYSGNGLLSNMLQQQKHANNNNNQNTPPSYNSAMYDNNNAMSPLIVPQSGYNSDINSNNIPTQQPILYNENATLASYSQQYSSDTIVNRSSAYATPTLPSSTLARRTFSSNDIGSYVSEDRPIDSRSIDNRPIDNKYSSSLNQFGRITNLQQPTIDNSSLLNNDYAIEAYGRYIHEQTLQQSGRHSRTGSDNEYTQQALQLKQESDTLSDSQNRSQYQSSPYHTNSMPSPIPRTHSAMIPTHHNLPTAYIQYNSYTDQYGDTSSGNSTPTLSTSYNSNIGLRGSPTQSPHLGTRTSSHMSQAIPIVGYKHNTQQPNKRNKHNYTVSSSLPVEHSIPLDPIPETHTIQHSTTSYTQPHIHTHTHNTRQSNKFDFTSLNNTTIPRSVSNNTVAEQMLYAYAAKIAPTKQQIIASSSPTSSFNHLSLNSPANVIEAVPLALDSNTFNIPIDQAFAGNGIGFTAKKALKKSLSRNKSNSTGDLTKLDQRKQTRLLRKAEQARASRARKKTVLQEMEAQVSLLERQIAEWTLERKKQRMQQIAEQQTSKQQTNVFDTYNDIHIGNLGTTRKYSDPLSDTNMNTMLSFNDSEMQHSTRQQLIHDVDQILQSVNHIVQPSSTEKLLSYLMSQNDEFYTLVPQLLQYEELDTITLQQLFNTTNKNIIDCAAHWHELIVRMHMSDELLQQLLQHRTEIGKEWTVMSSLSKSNRELYSVLRSHIELLHDVNEQINHTLLPDQQTAIQSWLQENNTIVDMLNIYLPSRKLQTDIQTANEEKQRQLQVEQEKQQSNDNNTTPATLY